MKWNEMKWNETRIERKVLKCRKGTRTERKGLKCLEGTIFTKFCKNASEGVHTSTSSNIDVDVANSCNVVGNSSVAIGTSTSTTDCASEYSNTHPASNIDVANADDTVLSNSMLSCNVDKEIGSVEEPMVVFWPIRSTLLTTKFKEIVN